MKKTKENKGITLILFVIIIITLIILGLVIVTLIQKNKTKVEEKVSEWSQERNYVTNDDIILEVGDRVKLKVDNGEYEEYSAEGYEGEWAVLGAEEGKLLLVSATEVQTEIDLYGKAGKTEGVPIDAGYNNGIEKLNKISLEYKNEKYAEEVRSIKIEDLIRVIEYEPEEGETKTYTENFEHPDGRKATEKNPITQTSIDYTYNVNYEHFTNTKAYQLLFKGANYWCATQYSKTYEKYAEYGYPIVYGDFNIFNYDLFKSDGKENLRPSGVRAVVKLKANVQVEKVAN